MTSKFPVKSIPGFLIFFTICFSSYGQEYESSELRSIDSLYNVSLLTDTMDAFANEQALLLRNNYGWILGKTEQLKKDIPALLAMPGYSREMAYLEVFNIQKTPAVMWDKLYITSEELTSYFSKNIFVYREMLANKLIIATLINKEDVLVAEFPKLITLLDSNSEMYGYALWQYGNALSRNNRSDEALAVLKKGDRRTTNDDFLRRIILVHASRKDYDSIISYEPRILKDSSGFLTYHLAEAYLYKNNTQKARIYFDLFSENIQFTEADAFIHYGNIVFHIMPDMLEILGDFYFETDKIKACQYYAAGENILKKPGRDFQYEKLMLAVKDEKQREVIKLKHDKEEALKQQCLVRIRKKLETCN